MGEIYLEIDQPDSAFQFLDRGAKTADSRLTREQIYFQIAELSYEKELYEQASDNYRNVLNNTISMSRVKESNLKIIQTYRLLGDLDKAKKRGTVVSIPERDEMTLTVNEQLVVELFSK